jgi:methionine-R-sulfoxide reductase
MINRRTVLKATGAVLFQATAGCIRHAGAADKGPTTKEANVKVKVFNKAGELVGPIEMPRVVKSDEEWKKQLTADQYKVARAKGTERPFCGNLLDNHEKGVYTCVCCGLPLFSSDSKFNSGTGWPSFFQPVAKENVIEHSDTTYGMERVEILCARCDCHLGHVFEDGPRPTGLRYCVNSESLSFTKSDKLATLADPAAEKATK